MTAASRLCAQGGPPMITDDPGTPGNNHWEINLAWTEQRTPGATLDGAPLLDANYGVGDTLQINYQASWNILRDAGASTASGYSDSQLALKWRFHDEGESGLQASVYPRFTFVNPGSDADRRGVTDSNPSFLLPFEVLRDFGFISVNADFGYQYSTAQDLRGWTGGICIGREVVKGWELDAEVHASSSDSADRTEVIFNVGTRVDLAKNATLLLAAGRDMHNALGPKVSLLTYIGIQIRL
ncbi:MAG TPA: hypothetical protein VFE25_14480 [Opitutaceae bacterium]|nr:hypothetical protein [Opitutaceae bacterium]